MFDNLEHLSGLVGTFLPMVIALVLQKSWATPVKAVVALLACAVAATITTGAAGQLNGQNWTESLAVIFTAAMVSFNGFWRPTGIADSLESATSFGSREAE